MEVDYTKVREAKSAKLLTILKNFGKDREIHEGGKTKVNGLRKKEKGGTLKKEETLGQPCI